MEVLQHFFYSCGALAAPCALRAGNNPSGEKGVKRGVCLSLQGRSNPGIGRLAIGAPLCDCPKRYNWIASGKPSQ
jgi:hypothetical protein